MSDMAGLLKCRYVKPDIRSLLFQGCELLVIVLKQKYFKLEFTDKCTILFCFLCENRLAEMNFANQKHVFPSVKRILVAVEAKSIHFVQDKLC